MAPPANALALKLSGFVVLNAAEQQVLTDLNRRKRTFEAGRDLVFQGQSEQAAFVLSSGWVCSYKSMKDGTRQVIDIQIPGDFLGLRSVLFRIADHTVQTITPAEATVFRTSDFEAILGGAPRLANALLWAASRDEAMVVEHLVDIGRRNAQERVAHFLLELQARLKLVGLADDSGYACPLSQYMLADALGLSAVHINRILRILREDGLVTFQKGWVTFHDHHRLVELAAFDRSYLDQEGPLLH